MKVFNIMYLLCLNLARPLQLNLLLDNKYVIKMHMYRKI